MRQKRRSCPICRSAYISFHDQFWRCKKCNYQFANPQDPKFTNRYYQSDIGLLAQNVLEEKNVEHSLRKYSKLAIVEITSLKKKGKVCDIGCGTGLFLKKIKRRGFEVYGYDINKSQTEIAKKSNNLQNISDAQSLTEYCRNKKIKEKTFDFITCFEVIEHIPDVNNFIAEIKRYLKPGGKLILSTPNYERFKLNEKWDYPPIHVSRFMRKNMQYLLSAHKFEITKFKTFNELGYYSGNAIAKLSVSHQVLEYFVESSEHSHRSDTANLQVALFKVLANTKKYLCRVLDLPLYVVLHLLKSKGHTMFVVAESK